MMIIKIFIICFSLMLSAVGCVYPQQPADLLSAKNSIANNTVSLSNAYPYWNTGFGSFIVANETVRDDLISSTSDLMKEKAKRLEVKEKSLMLEKLSLIRFVINTKEFEDELMISTFRSSRDASGPNGNITMGSTYNNKRILEVLRRRKYNLTIRKGIISAGAAAVGVVGPSLYVMSDKDKATSNSYWIAFPNHEDWAAGGYLQDTYMAGVVFHEMLHNTGFTHGVDSHDATYGIQGVFKNVYGKKEFREKYKTQLEQFRGYYKTVYNSRLQAPTLYSPTATYSLNSDIEIDDIHDTTGMTTCSLLTDGSYILE